MRFHATEFKRLTFGLLLGSFQAGSLLAQIQDSPIVFSNIDGVTATLVTCPSLGSVGNQSQPSQPKQWLKVELHYKVSPPNNLPFLDAVQFKVWVEGADLLAPDAPPSGQGVAVAMTGQVTYVNIPAARDAYAAFYVHPAALARYSSSTTGNQDDFTRRFNTHAEAYVSGTKVDFYDRRKEDDLSWYTKLRPIVGMIYNQNECPFFLSDTSRYPQIKAPPPAAP